MAGRAATVFVLVMEAWGDGDPIPTTTTEA